MNLCNCSSTLFEFFFIQSSIRLFPWQRTSKLFKALTYTWHLRQEHEKIKVKINWWIPNVYENKRNPQLNSSRILSCLNWHSCDIGFIHILLCYYNFGLHFWWGLPPNLLYPTQTYCILLNTLSCQISNLKLLGHGVM